MDPNPRRLLAGSPSSSEAVGSLQNTPETKLTAFSPEELRSENRAVKSGITRPHVPPTFALNVSSRPTSSGTAGASSVRALSDPFVGPSNALGAGLSSSLSFNNLPQLSPAATSFTPLGRQNLSLPAAAVKHRDEIGDSRTATPKPNASYSSLASQATAPAAVYGTNHATMSQPPSASQIVTSTFPKYGAFSTEHRTSRYLSVKYIPVTTPLSDVETIFNVSHP